MAANVFNLTGEGLIRHVADVLFCTVGSIIYQGPAMTLYAYAGVFQGADPSAHWEDYDANLISLIKPFNVPNSPSPATLIHPFGAIGMKPRPAGDPHAPVIGPGEAVLLISQSADMANEVLMVAKVLVPGEYSIQAVVSVSPPESLIASPYLATDGTSVVDLSWNRASGSPAPTIQAEFIDIVITDTLAQAQAAFNGTPGVDYVSIDTGTLPFGLQTTSDPNGRVRYHANGLPVTPNAHHWWRVNNMVNGQWYPSFIGDFVSAATTQQAPNISNITVTFS